jgi:hypothetical protein
MADGVNSTSTGSVWYGMSGNMSCNVEEQDLCTVYDPSTRPGAAPQAAVNPRGASPAAPAQVQDTADDCEAGAPAWYCIPDHGNAYPESVEWNNGKGLTRELDPEYARRFYEACVKDARTNYDRCIATQEYNAEVICENTPTRVGRDVDMRPVPVGDEKGCQERWIYGTDSKSIANAGTDTAHKSTNEGKAEQLAGKGTGSVKVKVSAAEVNVGGEGGGSVTWTDGTVRGTSRSDSHAEAATKAARLGTAEKCNSTWNEKSAKCGTKP